MKLWRVLVAVAALGLAPANSVQAATLIDFNSQSGTGLATYTEAGATIIPVTGTFLFEPTPNGTVGLRGTAHRGNRFLHPPADQSSSRMSGNLNRCGSFGRGSNILYVPEPTHFISAV